MTRWMEEASTIEIAEEWRYAHVKGKNDLIYYES